MVLGGGTVYLVVQGILPTGAALASALSASIAGIIMTVVEDGSGGLKLILMFLHLQLDVQQYQREPITGCCSAWEGSFTSRQLGRTRQENKLARS